MAASNPDKQFFQTVYDGEVDFNTEKFLVEVQVHLGPAWIAEQWDKGWTKVYTTIPYENFTAGYHTRVAGVLAQAITVLEPLRTLQ